MTPIILTFPVDPVPWKRPRFNAKRGFTDAKVKKFAEDLKYLALSQYGGDPFTGPLKVAAQFAFARPKTVTRPFHCTKPDCDNAWKAIGDCMEGILWKNDSQIVSLHLTKTYAPRGSITLEVTQL